MTVLNRTQIVRVKTIEHRFAIGDQLIYVGPSTLCKDHYNSPLTITAVDEIEGTAITIYRYTNGTTVNSDTVRFVDDFFDHDQIVPVMSEYKARDLVLELHDVMSTPFEWNSGTLDTIGSIFERHGFTFPDDDAVALIDQIEDRPRRYAALAPYRPEAFR